MKPIYSVLSAQYPRRGAYPLAKLYEYIGWGDLVENPAFTNTCATRMSIALLGAGVAVPGRLAIKAGPLKGRSIEPGQAKLSRILKRNWGAPEIYKSRSAASTGIGNRKGVVSFFRISGLNDTQGHIDIVEPQNNFFSCAMSCYFDAQEIWFWPLQ